MASALAENVLNMHTCDCNCHSDRRNVVEQDAPLPNTTLGKRRKPGGQRYHSPAKRTRRGSSPVQYAENAEEALQEGMTQAESTQGGVLAADDRSMQSEGTAEENATGSADITTSPSDNQPEELSSLWGELTSELCTTTRSLMLSKALDDRLCLSEVSVNDWDALITALKQQLAQVSEYGNEARRQPINEVSETIERLIDIHGPIGDHDLQTLEGSIPGVPTRDVSTFDEDKFLEDARRAAEATVGQPEQTEMGHDAVQIHAERHITHSAQHEAPTNVSQTLAESTQAQNVPPDTSPGSTRELYEQVLIAHAADRDTQKRLAHTVTAGNSSRRIWSKVEEDALMHALDHIGPHWTKIEAMYGADGPCGDALKDRSQVQMKDKARNLKLCFLRAGQPLPSCLSRVTGDLEKRAPRLADRQENTRDSAAKESTTSAADAEAERVAIATANEAEGLMSSPEPEQMMGAPEAIMSSSIAI